MTDYQSLVSALRRPRLLIRAARAGADEYQRDRDLGRLLSGGATPGPIDAVRSLLAAEASLEARRKAGDATYSVPRHVEVLIALMSEVRLLPRHG